MKTLKGIIEEGLNNPMGDLDKATALNELTKYEDLPGRPGLPIPQNGGWRAGSGKTRYEIDKDTLSILSTADMAWTCCDNEFFEIIEAAKIKSIENNCGLYFHDSDFDINGISFNIPHRELIIKYSNADIKNCDLNCSQFTAWDGEITLDKVNIKAPIVELTNITLNQKNTLIDCDKMYIRYDRIKRSDWGKYIKSLNIVEFTRSYVTKILREKVDLNENFVPLIPSTANKYCIYTGRRYNALIFEKSNNPTDYLIRFKNGWICRYEE